MVYLSYYEECPLFDSAEGGYYYAGNELIESERMSMRQAKKKIKEIAETLSKDPAWKIYKAYNAPGIVVKKKGKYIGTGCEYLIERKEGSHEKGIRPYC